MYGDSYVGATQMLAAMAHPPHLAGICPMFTPSNYQDGWVYQSGAFEQWFDESWTSILARETIDRYLTAATNSMPVAKTLPLWNYPLFNFDQRSELSNWTQTFAPYFRDWLAHPSFDSYWERWSIQDHYQDIHVPALTVAAWYDIFLGGSLRNYAGMMKTEASEPGGPKQYLLIAIGGHAGSGEKIGDVDFGPAAADFDEDAVTLEWYNYLFRGMKSSFAVSSPVKIFLMGTDRWQSESQWPPANARPAKYFLHSSGKANSAAGDGTLSTVPPGHESLDTYTYNPQNPVPTTGGPLCCDSHVPPGPRDQQRVEQRQDVLVYSTPPLPADFSVVGPVTLELYAKSSAVDTDFTAKLVDVDPNGYARNLTEGIVRARYRDSQSTPANLIPGKTYRFTIDLWATGNVFLAGHKIRLEISSSNFPRFDRNLNTGVDLVHAKDAMEATNEILHDTEHPSAVTLSVAEQ